MTFAASFAISFRRCPDIRTGVATGRAVGPDQAALLDLNEIEIFSCARGRTLLNRRTRPLKSLALERN